MGNKMVEVESGVWSVAIAKMIFLVKVTNYDIVYVNEVLALDESQIAKPYFSCLSKSMYERFMWVVLLNFDTSPTVKFTNQLTFLLPFESNHCMKLKI